MVGRGPEFGQRPTLGEIAKIKIGGKPVSGAELLQTINYLNQLKEQLGNEDSTKIDILAHFCENNGPERFMEILEEFEREFLLAALLETRGAGLGGRGRFGQLKGRFAESFIAECLNFMFQKDGLRILSPQETKNFLGSLFESFPVDGVFLEPRSNHTRVVGIGEYKAVRVHGSPGRSVSSKLDSQVELRDFLLSKGGEKYWSLLGENLPLGLPQKIEVVSKKNFRLFWVVAKGPTPGRQTLEERNTQILQIPFRIDELDKMTLVLLRQYCLEQKLIMEL